MSFSLELAVLSDDVPLVVSRQLLQTFAQELGRLAPETQKEIAHYTLAQIQPRVVSFEEQVLANLLLNLCILSLLSLLLLFNQKRKKTYVKYS